MNEPRPAAAEQAESVPFVDVGPYPTRSGNRLTPWIDGEPVFRRICEAIESARSSVRAANGGPMRATLILTS